MWMSLRKCLAFIVTALLPDEPLCKHLTSHITLIFRIIFLFWVSNRCLNALMFKETHCPSHAAGSLLPHRLCVCFLHWDDWWLHVSDVTTLQTSWRLNTGFVCISLWAENVPTFIKKKPWICFYNIRHLKSHFLKMWPSTPGFPQTDTDTYSENKAVPSPRVFPRVSLCRSTITSWSFCFSSSLMPRLFTEEEKKKEF